MKVDNFVPDPAKRKEAEKKTEDENVPDAEVLPEKDDDLPF